MVLIKLAVLTVLTCLSFSGPVDAKMVVSGDYLLSVFDDEIEGASADHPEAGLVRISLDGSGGGTFQDLILSDDGSLESGPLNYTLHPTGAVKLLPGEGFIPGIASQNAQLLTFAETGENAPGFIFGIKKPDAALTMATKSYIAVQFSDDIDNPGPGQTADEPSVILMELTLGADGIGSFQDLYSSDGEIENGAFTYSIDSTPADGNLTVTIDLPPTESSIDHTGIISQDGSVFTFPLILAEERGILVGIEKSDGDMDASKARGRYLMSQFADEIDNPGLSQNADSPASGIIEMVLDGKGNGTFRELYTSRPEGLTGDGSFTYTLSVNGELTVNTPGGEALHGILSKDGNIFILAETSRDYPAINVGIKKTPSGSQSALFLLLDED